MTQNGIGFEFTSEMHRWLAEAPISGPCCVVDNWTYGRIEITPTLRTYHESGKPVTFIARDWKTVNA
jgi:hypothetical protein